jgi:hypothetical protein
MKRLFRLLISSLPLLFLISCADNSVDPGFSSDLFGTWVYRSAENDLVIMEKSPVFDIEKYGFQIEKDGRYIERKINGWCGTPPVVYANYNGAWMKESDSVLKIAVEFWGGREDYKIEIVSVSPSILKYRKIN